MRTQAFKFLMYSFLFLFMSCEKNDDESDHKNYVLSNDNKYVKIKLLKPFNDYNVNNTNSEVAFVFQPDFSADYLYIAGKNIGKTDIVLSDKNDKESSISVSIRIDEYIFVKSAVLDLVYVKKGSTKTLHFEKMELDIPMVSNSNADIAKLSDFDNKERTALVEGLDLGITNVCLNNLCWSESGFRVNVVDNYPVHASWRDEDNVGNYEFTYNVWKPSRLDVLCGNGQYEVLISDPSVLECEIGGYSREFDHPMIENPATLKVTPLKARANTTLTIKDKEGQTLVFKIATGQEI